MTCPRWFTRSTAALVIAAVLSVGVSSCSSLSRVSPSRTTSIVLDDLPAEVQPYQDNFKRTAKELFGGKICATLTDDDLAPFRDPEESFEPPASDQLGEAPTCKWSLGSGHTSIKFEVQPTLATPTDYINFQKEWGYVRDRFAYSDRYLKPEKIAEKPSICHMDLVPDGAPQGVVLSMMVFDNSSYSFFSNQYDPTYGVCNIMAKLIETVITRLGWQK